MASEIIIRFARNDDLPQRIELVRRGYSNSFWDSFTFFFFQELTLECCVLGAAVLFIFFGVSASACLLLLPAAAVVVAAVVLCVDQALAYKHSQNIRQEIFGVVAEVRGALVLAPGKRTLPIRLQLTDEKDKNYSKIVGTVSVSEFWGPQSRGWLYAMVVHPEWRGRGVARALAGLTRRGAEQRGLEGLEAAASALQGAARAALHAAGWECRASYERQLVGSALTLPLVRLARDIPLP